MLKAEGGAPVLLRDVARVELAPDERRGITELNGEGEVVSGIAVQRYGQNALSVIENVKARLAEIKSSLPDGTEIVPVYDRSELIHRAIATLKTTLIEESIIVALVCVVFLLHVRSALVAIITLPLGVLIAYVCMHALGLSSNIMSLGGIAIAIGAMVDAAIVMIENAHKHLERAPPGQAARRGADRGGQRGRAGAVLLLLIITVSFLPIFTLEAQEGRLFKPLAYTKTFAMAAAAAALHHAGAGADDAVRARAHRSRAAQPGEPVPDLDLSAGHQARAEGQDIDHRHRSWRCSRRRLAGDAHRLRVHAEPERRHAFLHADDAAGDFDHQGGRAAADPEQIIKSFPEVVSVFGKAAAPARPPIPRRPRCSRPSST